MTIEQCNNCDLVERENDKLRKMIVNLHNQINVMTNTQQNVVKTIAKAAGVKIDLKGFILPGEKNFKITKGHDKVAELESKFAKILKLVNDKDTEVKELKRKEQKLKEIVLRMANRNKQYCPSHYDLKNRVTCKLFVNDIVCTKCWKQTIDKV